jgi:putative ABC transport system permease protein
MSLAGIGIVLGIAASLALSSLLQSLLFDVKPTDPLTYLSASAIFALVALLACYIPARRAAKVDPLVALRYE